MTKAKPIDRLELTRRKMAFKEAMKNMNDVPAAPGAEETQEHKLHGDLCPFCGGELTRFEGCYRCKKCGWSKC